MRELETCSARIAADMYRTRGAVTRASQMLEDSWPMTNTIIENVLAAIPSSCHEKKKAGDV